MQRSAPNAMIASLSYKASASSIECVVSSTDLFVFERNITFQIVCLDFGSRPVLTSSKSRIGGSPISAKHNVSLLLIPPDSDPDLTFFYYPNLTSDNLKSTSRSKSILFLYLGVINYSVSSSLSSISTVS